MTRHPLSDEVLRMVFAFNSSDSRCDAVRDLADRINAALVCTDIHGDEAKRWRDGYLMVADALAPESTSFDQLAEIARRIRRERDEARKQRDYAQHMEQVHVDNCANAFKRIAELEARLQEVLPEFSAVSKEALDYAARIAELEAALRETLVPLKALQLADGNNWSPALREQFAKAEPMALAALQGAPAQPATAAKTNGEIAAEMGGATIRRNVEAARVAPPPPAAREAMRCRNCGARAGEDGLDMAACTMGGAPHAWRHVLPLRGAILTAEQEANGKRDVAFEDAAEQEGAVISSTHQAEAPTCRHGCGYKGWSGHMNEEGFECGPCWTKRLDASREGK